MEEMQNESEPNRSSRVPPLTDSEIIHDVKLDETTGPSVRNTIVIKRINHDEKRIFFRKIIDDEEAFENPILFDEQIRNKYLNSQRATDPLSEALTNVFGKLPFSELHEVLSYEKLNDITSCLFIISAYTIENYFGKPGPKSVDSNDLYLYIHKLFGLNKSEENANFEIVKSIKSPEFFIKLFILEASGLKNIKNLNHLYCKVFKNSEPKEVEITNLAEEIAHPVWHVKFFFSIEDLNTDIITIELRNTKESIQNIKKEKNISRIKNAIYKKFVKKSVSDSTVKESCDLIGKVDVRVSDIYSEGIDIWIPLDCSETEFDDIFLHIRAKFGVTPLLTHSNGLRRHLMLLRIFIQEGMKNIDLETTVDSEILLSKCSLTLLFLHSVLSCLSESEDILCRFVVITHLGIKKETVSFQFLYHLLYETIEHLNQSSHDLIDSHLELLYKKEVQHLCNHCFQFISSLHHHIAAAHKKTVSEFEYVLKTIYLCQDVIDSVVAPIMVLKSEAVEWFERKAVKMMDATPENRALYITDFLDYLLRYQKCVDETVRKIFPKETYTEMTYKQLQDILYDPLKLHISEFSRDFLESLDTTQDKEKMREEGIEMFSKMKQLVFYISTTVDVPALDLKLSPFRQWFGKSLIMDWFQYRQAKAEKEIENAVVSDDLKALDFSSSSNNFYKESSSARKTRQIITESLKELWDSVSFPRSDKCDELFTTSLHGCCVKYSKLLKELVLSRHLLEEFHLKGRTCLCVLENDLWFTAMFAEQAVLDTIGTIPPNLPSAKLSLEDSCQEISLCIVDKYWFDIERLLSDIFENMKAKDEADLSGYSSYIKKIIWNEMYIDTSFDVFVIFLKNLSTRIINLLQHYVKKNDKKEIEVFSLVKDVLICTKNVSNIPDKPDENSLVWGENYSELLSELETD